MTCSGRGRRLLCEELEANCIAYLYDPGCYCHFDCLPQLQRCRFIDWLSYHLLCYLCIPSSHSLCLGTSNEGKTDQRYYSSYAWCMHNGHCH